MIKNYIVPGIAVTALVVSLFVAFSRPQTPAFLGAAGGMLVEQYDPYNRYNDGYKSENEIVLLGADGDLTLGDQLNVAGDIVSTQSALCFNFYATSTATIGKLVASTTATIEGVDGVMMFQYGSCQS